jgi:hypothetical protein
MQVNQNIRANFNTLLNLKIAMDTSSIAKSAKITKPSTRI